MSTQLPYDVTKFKDADAPKYTYMDFLTSFGPTEVELQRQRDEKFEYNPLMSIVIPMYMTPEKYLIELVRQDGYEVVDDCLKTAKINSKTPTII